MDTLINGYISVASVIKSGSRDITKIIIDTERRKKVESSDYHFPEKKQYTFLDEYFQKSNVTVDYITTEEFDAITPSTAAGGIAAYVGERKIKTVAEVLDKGNGFYLIVDGIEDPFNFGYVLRTAYASGCSGVMLPERNYFTSSEIVIRSSAGASELLDIAYYTDIDAVVTEVKSHGVMIACTSDGNGSQSLEKTWLNLPICVVIGGERRGVNKELMSKADAILRVDYRRSYEMSLAASSAASIILYEVSKKIFSGVTRPANPRPAYSHDGPRPAYKRDGGKPSFNRDGGKPSYNRDGGKPSYNRDGVKPAYNHDGPKPAFNRDGDKPAFNRDGDKPSFNRDGAKPAYNRDGAKPSYNRDGGKPSYNRDGGKPSYNRDGAKPAYTRDGDKPAFSRDGDKPAKSFDRPYNGQKPAYGHKPGFSKPGFSKPGFSKPGFVRKDSKPAFRAPKPDTDKQD